MYNLFFGGKWFWLSRDLCGFVLFDPQVCTKARDESILSQSKRAIASGKIDTWDLAVGKCCQSVIALVLSYPQLSLT